MYKKVENVILLDFIMGRVCGSTLKKIKVI